MPSSRVVLLSILLSAASGVALAQPAGPSLAGPPGDPGRWNPAEMRAHAEARHAERAKALHDVLGIRPEQEQAFTAFVAAMHPPEGDRHGGRMGRDRMSGGRAGPGDAGSRMAMTTPERLDHMKAEMDRRFAAMREAFDRRAQATRTLYAALDTRQRAAMDALPELGEHHGGMGHGGGMGGRMGHEGPTEEGM